jgi:tetratricopeptide (TPR) repeat protein
VISGELADLLAAAKSQPRDAAAQARLAGRALELGDEETAVRALDRALGLDAKNPDALWFKARHALSKKDDAGALRAARALASSGHDGYEVQSLIARAVDPGKEPKAFEAALVRAHEFDPERPDPLFALLRAAAEQQDTSRELEWLLKIAPVVEHDGAVYRRLAELLLESGEVEAAQSAAQSAVYADMEHPESYLALGRAEERRGHHARAQSALETATVCPADPPLLAQAHETLAGFLERRGQRARAAKERARARELGQ